jgi:hypothetical protein
MFHRFSGGADKDWQCTFRATLKKIAIIDLPGPKKRQRFDYLAMDAASADRLVSQSRYPIEDGPKAATNGGKGIDLRRTVFV